MMSNLPSNIGVFYGQVDKRSRGWYWTDLLRNERSKAAFAGPYETKEQAVENALQTPSGEPEERGAT
jgi:hypothetical protein